MYQLSAIVHVLYQSRLFTVTIRMDMTMHILSEKQTTEKQYKQYNDSFFEVYAMIELPKKYNIHRAKSGEHCTSSVA